MSRDVFADTFYFVALLSPRDAAHEDAVRLSSSMSGGLVTTDAVLLELADTLKSPGDRQGVARYLRALWRDADVRVSLLDRELLERSVDLYEARQDKTWSLTDCISFVVMQDEGIQDALTGDAHFEQAGFRTLFPRR
jgi:hypothetical protein